MENSVTFGKRRNIKTDESSTDNTNTHSIINSVHHQTSYTPDCLESLRSHSPFSTETVSSDDGKIHASNSPSFSNERSLKHRSEFQKRPPMDPQQYPRKTNFLAKKLQKSPSGSCSSSQLNNSTNSVTINNDNQMINRTETPDKIWKKSKVPSTYSFQPIHFQNQNEQIITLNDCPTLEKKLEYLNDIVAKMEKRTRELKTIALKQQFMIDSLKKKLNKKE